MKIDSKQTLKNGTRLYYEVIENGFDIYFGNKSPIPYLHQPEPFIPNPSLSYEENAINMCKELAEDSNIIPEKPFIVTEEMYNKHQSDIDFLMLMSDSAL